MIVVNKKDNQPYTHTSLIDALIKQGYNRVDMVLDIGDIAVRGSIIDVFGYQHTHPTRIDFFDTQIDRLNSFDCHTQCSIRTLSTVTFNPKPENEETGFHQIKRAETGFNHHQISAFQSGDFVVHEQFGVGEFKGLIRLTNQSYEGEFIQINYKGNDILYVPLDQLDFIHPYSGVDNPRINHLYDASWKKTKQRVSKTTKELAASIYQLHQQRQQMSGFAFSTDTESQIEFEHEFPHDLTPDQSHAVTIIKEQMEAPYPMDLLLCGDVGFGKTEVIFRATFKALENLKQVAILVPTTILCAQHVKTLTQRLQNYGYIVGELSRFKSKDEQRDIISKLKHHQIDVVIGTHRLLSKSIEFKDLGLLVVDEEQRFGVTHKERLKTEYPKIDVITVSATPIPRTLYMALSGAKTCVQVNTPPPTRKPIFTHLSEFNESIIKSAITAEICRNGQVYYVFNAVKHMNLKYKQLSEYFPNYSIGIAHGQLNEAALNRVMTQFYKGKIDILLCTTIIENGLDFSNANTMVIDEVDRLGISQIHQLRGRVGRCATQGYAYLFYRKSSLKADSLKRLQKIKEYTSLGCGYELAKTDLEHRGAGQLFGKEQSGHIQAVGFQLYCQLLETELNKMKGISASQTPKIPLNPEKIQLSSHYISQNRERVALYIRFLSIQSESDWAELKSEMIDRYGALDDKTESVMAYIKDQIQWIGK
jgi:transcription-repair coupling factor (superfamily II helicase)